MEVMKVQTLGDYFLISSPEYEDGWPYVDIIGFSPKRRVAVIESAKNDEEPEHENKLSLTRIYNALAKRGGVEPDEIRLMSFTVEKEDTKTNELIAEIRKGRNIGSWKGVKILPGDKEWDMILATQYFVKLLQVVNKPAQKILLSTRKYIDRWDRTIVHTNYISFHFGQPDIKTPVPGTAPGAYVSDIQSESDDEEQEAALKALFAEEDKNRDALQVEMAHHLAKQVLEAEERI
ncbi:hypothetical protein HOO65_100019 [Ceratocystis lukuohia]|uniref:Uncharacterized protein n=1 Tax=Ceratocystis lukuohia TaxID=2019550 RepID=A0ABR4M8L4_9PEZI